MNAGKDKGRNFLLNLVIIQERSIIIPSSQYVLSSCSTYLCGFCFGVSIIVIIISWTDESTDIEHKLDAFKWAKLWYPIPVVIYQNDWGVCLIFPEFVSINFLSLLHCIYWPKSYMSHGDKITLMHVYSELCSVLNRWYVHLLSISRKL